MDYTHRLKVLVEHALIQDGFSPGSDSKVLALTAEKQAAWKKIIGSIISAEAAEERVLKPVLEAFSFHPLVKQYVHTHARDEEKHAGWLKLYLKTSFQFERKKQSLSSKIIYGNVLPFVSRATCANHPMLVLIVVYFYEVYSQFIYSEAKKAARRDELPELVSLIERIEKDERRHLAGIEAVTEFYQNEVKSFKTSDWFLAKMALQIARIDLAQAPWAIHNRELAKQVSCLGISTEAWHARGEIAEQKSLELILKA